MELYQLSICLGVGYLLAVAGLTFSITRVNTMQPQIGYEFFGRVIVWRNVPLTEFFERAKVSLSGPGMEMSDTEIVSVFADGLIQRDHKSGRYYRARAI